MVIPNLPNNLRQFIEGVYHEPYSLLFNSCFHKSIKIARRAQELGLQADLILCWSIVPIKALGGLATIQPHMYAEVNGQKVDVSLDPASEEKHCRNEEKGIFLPLKLPRLNLSRV